MEIFQDISSRTIIDFLILDSGHNLDEPGSSDSIEGVVVKQIIVGGIIGATFISLVYAHWMFLHKKNI